MAMQAIVQNGMEVLQATAMEGIDEVLLTPSLSKLGIHLITVCDLKEEVRSRNSSIRHPSELLDLLILENRKEQECQLMGLGHSLEIPFFIPSSFRLLYVF